MPRATEWMGYAARFATSGVDAWRQRRELAEVDTFLLFVGYRRSGHNLVGSLLDAHPETLTAPEFDAVRYLRYGFRPRQVAALVAARSREMARAGRGVSGYSYVVPGQWQGRARRLRVVGAVRGGASARALLRRAELLPWLRERVGWRLRFLHVVRNPFDNISTMALRGRSRRDLDSAIEDYFEMAEGVAQLQQRVAAGELHALRSEDLVADPRRELAAVAGWLGLDAPADWLEACAGVVFPTPRRTRGDAPWTPEQVERVAKRMQAYDFLAGYGYDPTQRAGGG
jgi:hypothetical protein